MPKYLLTISCPCCKKRIEVDTRSGKARSLEIAEADREGHLDALVDQQRREEHRLGDAFSQAAEAEKAKQKGFDDLFERSLEEAKDDDETRPRNPFDLD